MSNLTIPPSNTSTPSTSQKRPSGLTSSQPPSALIPRRYSVFPRSAYSHQSRSSPHRSQFQFPTTSQPSEPTSTRPLDSVQPPASSCHNAPHTTTATATTTTYQPWSSPMPSSTPYNSTSTAPPASRNPAPPPLSVPSTSHPQFFSRLPNLPPEQKRPVSEHPPLSTSIPAPDPASHQSRPVASRRQTPASRSFPIKSAPPMMGPSASHATPPFHRSLANPDGPCHIGTIGSGGPIQGQNTGRDRPRPKSTRHHPDSSASSHRSPRKRQKRSFVWNFFRESEKDPNVALCQICNTPTPRGRNLARNTTNLRKHLEHRHPDFVKQFRLSQPHFAAHSLTSQLLPPTRNPPSSAVSPSYIPQSSIPARPHPPPASNGPARKPDNVKIPPTHSLPPIATSPTHQVNRSAQNPIHHTRNPARVSCKPPALVLQECHPEYGRPKNATPTDDPPLIETDKRFHGQDKPSDGDVGHASNANKNLPSVPNGDVPSKHVAYRLTVEDIMSAIRIELTRAQLDALQTLLDSFQMHRSDGDIGMTLQPSLWQQVSVLQRKIRNGLSAADTIAVTVEKSGSNLFVLCHYYERRFDARCVCVDVIPCADMLDMTDAEDSDDTEVGRGPGDSQHFQMLGKLFQRITNNLSYWKIRCKVIGVVVAGRGVGCGRWRFLPEGSTKSDCDKNEEGSLQNTWRTENEVTENGGNRDCSGLGIWNDARIAVVPCVVDTLERIVTESICEHEIFEKKFIVPLSELMFRALLDRNFGRCRKAQEWTSQVELPIRNVTLRSMVFMLEYVCENMSAIEKAVRNSTDNSGDVVLGKIVLEEMKVARDVLEAFSSAVAAIRIDDSNGECDRLWCCERSSAGLPIMRTLHERLEKLVEQIPDPMQYLVGLALHVVHNEWKEMEKTEIHGCATLLDPRFKSRYFSSKEAIGNVVSVVVDLCDAERRRRRLSRMREGRRSDGSATRQVSGSESGITDSGSGGLASWDNTDGHRRNGTNGGLNSNEDARRAGNKASSSGGASENFETGGVGCGRSNEELDYLMDAIAPGQRVSAGEVMAYLNEGRTELSQNVEEYWEKNHLRWPFLTSVATRYSLIPCCCFGLERATKGTSTEQGAIVEQRTDTGNMAGPSDTRALLRGWSSAAASKACDGAPSGSARSQRTAATMADGQRAETNSGEELGKEFLRSNLIIAERQLH